MNILNLIQKILEIDQNYSLKIDGLRNDNQKACNESSRHFNTIANQDGSEFNKVFMALATLMIPLFFVILSNDKLFTRMTIIDKKFLYLSFISLVISIFMGAWQLYLFFEHHDRWAVQENKRGKLFSDPLFSYPSFTAASKYNDMVIKSNELNQLSSKASRIPLYIQITLIVVGMLFFIISMSNVF